MPRVNVKDKRKQQLMEANIASIARRGLAETTIAHVSKGAGMSRGIVNFYFTSKEKMMQETLMFMAEEATNTWMEVYKAERANNSDSIVIAEAVLRVMMSDRICSQKRMAVWSAFFGEAAANAAFAKIIKVMDDTLTAHLKKLWQEAGYEPKPSEMHARMLQSLIRGHWLMSALSDSDRRPSTYIDPWVELLTGTPPEEDARADKKPVPRPRKVAGVNQLDFTELLASNG